MKLRKVFIILLIFISGCSKQEASKAPVEPEKEPTLVIPFEGFHASSTVGKRSFDTETSEIEVELHVSYELVSPILRYYVLVDGTVSEFSIDGSEYNYYQDLSFETDSDTLAFSIQPTLREENEDVVIEIYSMWIDDSWDYIDDFAYYYTPIGLSVPITIKINNFKFNNGEVIKHEFSIKHPKDHEYDDFVANGQTVPTIRVLEKDNHKENFLNGRFAVKYGEEIEYYLGKSGIGDVYIYPLKNGDLIMVDNKPLLFYFPEGYDDIYYSRFNFEAYGFEVGDILGFLTYNATVKESFSQYGRIMMVDK